MERSEMAISFNTLVYLGDSLLQVVELKTGKAECRLKLDSARVLAAKGDSIFDPKETIEPALLLFRGVKEIACDGSYQLNSTVVDFGARLCSDGEYIEFYLDLTGGTDADAFLVKVKIIAKDFELGRWTD